MQVLQSQRENMKEIQEQKEDEKKPTHGKKAKVNSIGHQWAVRLGIKDGRWIMGMNSFGDSNPGKPAKHASMLTFHINGSPRETF